MRPSFEPWKGWREDTAGAAVCLAMGLGVFLWGVCPVTRRHDEIDIQRAQLTAQQARAARSRHELASMKDCLEGARLLLTKQSVRLRGAAGLNRRVSELSDLAAASGLTVDEVFPGRAEQARYHAMIPIRLTGTGGYRACAVFLHNLRERFPDTHLRSLDLTGNPAKGTGRVGFRLDLLWHTLPEGASLQAQLAGHLP